MDRELNGAEYVDKPAVRDGNKITGRSMASSIEFALEIVEFLLDKETADKVASGIVFER